MAYLKRVFLNPIAEGAPSFIQAVVEAGDEGTYLLGTYLFILAGCDRSRHARISRYKCEGRKKARAKVDRLGPVVNAFRAALIKEIELMEKARAILSIPDLRLVRYPPQAFTQRRRGSE